MTKHRSKTTLHHASAWRSRWLTNFLFDRTAKTQMVHLPVKHDLRKGSSNAIQYLKRNMSVTSAGLWAVVILSVLLERVLLLASDAFAWRTFRSTVGCVRPIQQYVLSTQDGGDTVFGAISTQDVRPRSENRWQRLSLCMHRLKLIWKSTASQLKLLRETRRSFQWYVWQSTRHHKKWFQGSYNLKIGANRLVMVEDRLR